MTSDVIDLDELNTGKRREGVFGAIYWWMVKFGFAIAGLLTGAIMTLVGFVPDAVNSEASIQESDCFTLVYQYWELLERCGLCEIMT